MSENELTDQVLREMAEKMRRFISANIPLRFYESNLNNFKAETEKQKLVVDKIKRYIRTQRFGPEHGLILTGGPGVGKTHLMCSIEKYFCLGHGTSIKYETFRELLSRIGDYEGGANHIELFAIDEVGAFSINERQQADFFHFINERYNFGLPTIMASNLSIKQLRDLLGQRVLERVLEGGELMVMDWESYRNRNADDQQDRKAAARHWRSAKPDDRHFRSLSFYDFIGVCNECEMELDIDYSIFYRYCTNTDGSMDITSPK